MSVKSANQRTAADSSVLEKALALKTAFDAVNAYMRSHAAYCQTDWSIGITHDLEGNWKITCPEEQVNLAIAAYRIGDYFRPTNWVLRFSESSLQTVMMRYVANRLWVDTVCAILLVE
jgi:hypothetical protein